MDVLGMSFYRCCKDPILFFAKCSEELTKLNIDQSGIICLLVESNKVHEYSHETLSDWGKPISRISLESTLR